MNPQKKNIIDIKLEKLQKEGKISGTMLHEYTDENLGFAVANFMSFQYWNKFVSFLTEEEIDFILSVPQKGNWNYWLYAEAQRTRGILQI